MSKQVVVLTPGRAGSSMLARVLMELGVFMGYVGCAPDHANPLGYWEDRDFAQINHDILHDLPYPQPVHRPGPPFVEKMTTLIARRNAKHKVWGWKDSHTALTIAAWHRLLDNPHYLYITRPLEAVVASYVRAWNLHPDGVRGNYLIYTICIEQFLANRPHLRLDYEELLETRDVKQISAFLGLNGVDVNKAQTIIRPEMKHV